jgi:hypothetical protein
MSGPRAPVGAADSTIRAINEPGSADSMHGMMNGTLTDLQWRPDWDRLKLKSMLNACLFNSILYCRFKYIDVYVCQPSKLNAIPRDVCSAEF